MSKTGPKRSTLRNSISRQRNPSPPPGSDPLSKAIISRLGFDRFSALWVWAAIVVIFAIWVPETFLTTSNLKIVLTGQAVTAIIALGLVAPLAAGVIDLTVGAAVGFTGMLAAVLMARHGWGTAQTIAVTLVIGCCLGTAVGLVVSKLRIDSIIVTLAVSSILSGLIIWLSNTQNVVGLNPGFLELGSGGFLSLAWPFWIMLLVCLIMWFVFDHTVTGRYIHATGQGEEAARLSGVPTARLIVVAFAVSAVAAALAGLLGTARIGAGDPSFGPSYLLPAYAAVFLGSTQVRPGFFNPWGTVIAVYLLATGVKGLQLVGAPYWIPDVFNGAALLLAVGLSVARNDFRLRQALTSRRKAVAAKYSGATDGAQ